MMSGSETCQWWRISFFLSLFFLFVIKLNEMIQKGCVEVFFARWCLYVTHISSLSRKVFKSINMSQFKLNNWRGHKWPCLQFSSFTDVSSCALGENALWATWEFFAAVPPVATGQNWKQVWIMFMKMSYWYLKRIFFGLPWNLLHILKFPQCLSNFYMVHYLGKY